MTPKNLIVNQKNRMTKRGNRAKFPTRKAKVALAEIEGEKTLGELVRQFDVQRNQSTTLQSQLPEAETVVFGQEENATRSSDQLEGASYKDR